jgi:hypothetical protein
MFINYHDFSEMKLFLLPPTLQFLDFFLVKFCCEWRLLAGVYEMGVTGLVKELKKRMDLILG